MQPWHVLFFMAFIIWVLSDVWKKVVFQDVVNYDDPLYRRKDNFMEAETFDNMAAYVLRHPFVGNFTELQQTTGMVAMVHTWAHCNFNGFQRLCTSSDIRFLCDSFLKRVRNKDTNAYKLKLFASYAVDYAEAPSYYAHSLPLQGEDGPAIDDRYNRWGPKIVSILDIQVPKSIKGGGLQVFENTDQEYRSVWAANRAGPARVESPLPNALHTLRGDAFYTYADYWDPNMPYCHTHTTGVLAGVCDASIMPNEVRRLSLIFEQYSIKNESYGLTSEYDVWRKFVEDEKPIYAFGIVMYAVMGAFAGAGLKQKELEDGNVIAVLIGIVAGGGMGAVAGFTSMFASVEGTKGLKVFVQGIQEYIYDGHFVYSPEVTIWFLMSTVCALISSAVIELFREPLKRWFKGESGKGFQSIAENISVLAVGDSGLTSANVRAPGAQVGGTVQQSLDQGAGVTSKEPKSKKTD